MIEVKINDAKLQHAAEAGMDEFVKAFVDAIREAIGGELTAETMAQLNSDQITLLAWDILHEEMMDGGMVQLIHNGYGAFLWKNPTDKAFKNWGLTELAKLIKKSHFLYKTNHEEIERDLTDEEFMALYEKFPEFDDFDDEFVENEEEWTSKVAFYIDDHIDNFCEIVNMIIDVEQELRKKSPIQIRNKKASFEYFFVDTYTAGIVLTGTEIKSIRGGKASLVDCYCDFYQGELWVKGMNISPYFYGSFSNHEARRDRKLLLTKRELRRLEEDSKQPGFTIVPTLIFIDNHGRAKVDIALCKGKKEYDKRQTLKEKEDRREMDRAIKHF